MDDTGHDVKFFGASAGAFMLYDESADVDALHQNIDRPSTSSVTDSVATKIEITQLTEGTIKSILLVLYNYSLPSHDYLRDYGDIITKVLDTILKYVWN